MRKYVICSGSASDLVPDALHIERNDALCEELGIIDEYDDFAAALDAEKDGVKLISGIAGIYNNFYVDTPENREIINRFLRNRKIYCFSVENSMNEIIEVRVPACSEQEAQTKLWQAVQFDLKGQVSLDHVEEHDKA